MVPTRIHMSRRSLLATGMAAGSIAAAPAWASLVATPRQTSGPFYPLELPLDDDNDLTVVDGASVGATGDIIHVTGVFSASTVRPLKAPGSSCGRLTRLAVTITRSIPAAARSTRASKASATRSHPADGGYRFKTIRPGLYPGRARHLHFAVLAPDGRELVTQMYFAGEPGNDKDGLLRSIGDPAQRQSVIVDFAPAADDPDATLGQFDMVLA